MKGYIRIDEFRFVPAKAARHITRMNGASGILETELISQH